MHLVTFTAQSKAVLQHLSQKQQLQLIAFLSELDFQKVSSEGKITRGEKTFYRVRWNDCRIYFECVSEELFLIHYLLPKHTWNDFLFRSHLPMDEKAIEKDPQFWQWLEKFKF